MSVCSSQTVASGALISVAQADDDGGGLVDGDHGCGFLSLDDMFRWSRLIHRFSRIQEVQAGCGSEAGPGGRWLRSAGRRGG